METKLTKDEIITRYNSGQKVTEIVKATGSYRAIYDALNGAKIRLRRNGQKPEESLVQWALPPQLKVVADPLRLRLDFHNDTVLMHIFDKEIQETRVVAALDIAHTLAGELTYGTGLLPADALWWQNTAAGPIVAIWQEPKVRRLSVSTGHGTEIKRYDVPLPGIILICHSGIAPWAYAAKSRPTKPTDTVFKAPLANVYDDGRSCPGSTKYPARVAEIPQTFWISFFSTSSFGNRSHRHPTNIIDLWESLNGKKEFPLDDLVKHGTVSDLMNMFNNVRRKDIDLEGVEEDDDE